jgi:histidinol-phosphate aminotransferase
MRLRPHLMGLTAYDPGQDLLPLRARFGPLLAELGANENPFGPSPQALAAYQAAAALIHRYPDPGGSALKRALAALLGHPEQGIVLGNGSHELLVLLGRCFAGPGDQVLFSRYGFAVFPIAAALAGAEAIAATAFPEEHPRALGHDPGSLAAALSPRVRILYIANPNNPTGSWLSLAEIEGLLRKAGAETLVVVDEAYQEYVIEGEPESAVSLLSHFPQLVVTRTFSKAYGLAGLRLGYLLAHPEVAAVLERCRETFNVNQPAQEAGLAALGDVAHLHRVRERNASQRDELAFALRALGLQVYPSRANFLLVRFGANAARLGAALLERGIVLRPLAAYGLKEHLRVTVGRPEENERLIAALKELLR